MLTDNRTFFLISCMNAHLSRRLIGELIVKEGSVIRASVCILSTFSNIFFSEINRPIEAKFHVEPPWDE